MLPMPITYYRIHDKQITASKRDLQKEVALQCLYRLHESILGELTDQDRALIDNLSGWCKVDSGTQLSELFSYINRLSYCYDGDGISRNSSQEYLYLAWSSLNLEIIKRDYRNWRDTALKLRKTSEEFLHANQSNEKEVQIIYQDARLPPQLDKILNKPNYGLLGWRRIFLIFIYLTIYVVGGKSQINNFKKDPLKFMLGLKKRRYHLIRRLLFPQ